MTPQKGTIIFCRKAKPELHNKHIHRTHSSPQCCCKPNTIRVLWLLNYRLTDWNTALGLTAWTYISVFDRPSSQALWHSQSPGGDAAEARSSHASSSASYEYRQSYLNSPIRLHSVLLNSAPKNRQILTLWYPKLAECINKDVWACSTHFRDEAMNTKLYESEK